MSTGFHIAQANVARAVADMDDPAMADFAAQLDPINALADASPGFVWRLQSESGNATDIQVFDDPRILVNLSVWETLDALRAFAYRSAHRELLRSRPRWFTPVEGPGLVLWWVPAGQLVQASEIPERLALLASRGPSPEAFTFRESFGPEGTPLGR